MSIWIGMEKNKINNNFNKKKKWFFYLLFTNKQLFNKKNIYFNFFIPVEKIDYILCTMLIKFDF